MKKRFSFVALICSFLIFCSLYASAHPGRTDASGGHWDRSDGTYHFHTGEYAGKSSSGNSSNSTNVPFTPPYDPPTENPYTKETNQNSKQSNSDKTDIVDIIVYIIISSPLLFILLSFLLVFIKTLLPKNRIKELNEKMDELLSRLREKVEIEISILDFESNALIPEKYEIGADGFPKEKDHRSWGETFTVYKTPRGKRIHTKKGCCSAYIPQNIFKYMRYGDIKSVICSKCGNNYTPPDLSWYTSFRKYEDNKKKFKQLNTECLQLREKLTKCHKKCNSSFTRFLLIFSKKNRTQLKIANTTYDSIQIDLKGD